MTKPITSHKSPADKLQPASVGKDEMNLAEFPLTKMGTRDERNVLVYNGWATDRHLGRYQQKWTVRAATGLGLPNEFGDRVLLALLALTFRQNPLGARVGFTRYQLLKLLGVQSIGSKEYEHLENVLLQLAGVTIVSERAFFDQNSSRRPLFKQAFHIFSELHIRADLPQAGRAERAGESTAAKTPPREERPALEAHTAPMPKAGDRDTRYDAILANGSGFITWSPEFWSNLQGGYIKDIDLDFFNALPTPLARRLYRLLDKRMHYRAACEMDIFELSGRLGQPRYDRPSQVFRKLKPSIDVLVAERFLKSAAMVKYGIYTRVRFERWEKGEFARHQEQQRKHAQQIERVKSALNLDAQTVQALAAAWTGVLEELRDRLPATVHAILNGAQLVRLQHSVAVVVVQNRFAAERLTAQWDLATMLAATLTPRVGEPVTKIAFVDVQSAGALKDI